MGWNLFLGHEWDFSQKNYRDVIEFLIIKIGPASRGKLKTAILDWWDAQCAIVDPNLPDAEKMLEFTKVTEYPFDHNPITEDEEAEQNRKLQELQKAEIENSNSNNNNLQNNANNQTDNSQNQNKKRKQPPVVIDVTQDGNEELECTPKNQTETESSKATKKSKLSSSSIVEQQSVATDTNDLASSLSIAIDTTDLQWPSVQPNTETLKFECINEQLITSSFKIEKDWECNFNKGNFIYIHI